MIIDHLDHLPYADADEDAHRAAVEAAVRSHLPASRPLHPAVDALVPLPVTMAREIERYEADAAEHTTERTDTPTDTDAPDQLAAYQSLFYALSENSNLQLLLQNNESMGQLQDEYLQELGTMKTGLHEAAARKRRHLDDVNSLRKRRQVDDLKPVQDYLEARYQDGLQGVVDTGVEALARQQSQQQD